MLREYQFGSVFAGIGGMDLGLERAGMKCAWQVEIDPYCRQILSRHWPLTPRHDDVATFAHTDTERWNVDIIAGGFPCQEISNAGRRQGIEGPRSGLWSEYARIIRVLRPEIAIVENVASLTHRGLGKVLGDLAFMGMDAQWFRLSAAEVGADTERKRAFIVAYRVGKRRVSGPSERRIFDESLLEEERPIPARVIHTCRDTRGRIRATPESGIHRVADGFPTQLDLARLKALGNCIDPRVAERVGRAVLRFMAARSM